MYNHESTKIQTYSEFIEHNKTCYKNLSQGEISTLYGILNMIERSTLRLVDMESTSSFEAAGFYFDDDKQLVIWNDR